MKIRRYLLCCCALVGAALAGTGCKSSRGRDAIPPTASGLPEIELRAKTDGEVKRVATAFFLNRGYVETRSRHLYEMVFDRATKKRGRALRVRLRLHKQDGDTWRLVGTPLGVDRWRTDLESETVLPQGSAQIREFLVEIKNRVESAR